MICVVVPIGLSHWLLAAVVAGDLSSCTLATLRCLFLLRMQGMKRIQHDEKTPNKSMMMIPSLL
jgi:hypothetical protein